jgi:hypothetical protein
MQEKTTKIEKERVSHNTLLISLNAVLQNKQENLNGVIPRNLICSSHKAVWVSLMRRWTQHLQPSLDAIQGKGIFYVFIVLYIYIFY